MKFLATSRLVSCFSIVFNPTTIGTSTIIDWMFERVRNARTKTDCFPIGHFKDKLFRFEQQQFDWYFCRLGKYTKSDVLKTHLLDINHIKLANKRFNEFSLKVLVNLLNTKIKYQTILKKMEDQYFLIENHLKAMKSDLFILLTQRKIGC